LFATSVIDTGGKFAAVVIDTGGYLPLVPTMLAKLVDNLLSVLLIQVANLLLV
jgi:hypothetical protein